MGEYINWKLEKDEEGILWCSIDVIDRSLNILTKDVFSELEHIITDLECDTPKGFVLLSGKESGFIAGADINEFTRINTSEEALGYINQVHALFNRIESLSCPTLAMIRGVCLGGGLELAMAFDYRIVLDEPATRLGLPEVLLGIHPGFAGSVRFIRLAGALQGLELMLAGKAVDARKAKRLGLAEHCVPLRQFRIAATQLIRKRPKKHIAKFEQRVLSRAPFRALLANYIRKQLRKRIKQAHYPAPFALLELWEKYGDNEKRMMQEEARSVAHLITTATSRSLVRAYLLQERLKTAPGDVDFEPQHIHVVGAGVMGGDISAWCASQGMRVTLQDREATLIGPAIKRAASLFRRRLKAPRHVRAAMDRLSPDMPGEGARHADVFIEAISEHVDRKSNLFKAVETHLKADAILATNTSSIALEALGGALADPGKLVGIHFFNPVARMQLVEIVHAEETRREWVDKAKIFCKKINKLPLVVKSAPGFLVNRILAPYLMETMLMMEEGIQAEAIDQVATDFGMPMGPVELADTIGLDIGLSVSEIMSEKIGLGIPDILKEKVDKGHTGKKAGRGFYQYKKGKPQKRGVSLAKDQALQIENRLVLRLLNECAGTLREGIVDDMDMLDAGMIFGAGFAPFRGGPMYYARQRGIGNIVRDLTALQSSFGERFTADSYWGELGGEE